jgi:hypothetical protein
VSLRETRNSTKGNQTGEGEKVGMLIIKAVNKVTILHIGVQDCGKEV